MPYLMTLLRAVIFLAAMGFLLTVNPPMDRWLPGLTECSMAKPRVVTFVPLPFISHALDV